MGTEITLAVGGIDLTYSKNHLGWDHGSLFQERDRKHIVTQLDEGSPPGPMEMGFSRPLKDAVPRLEMLGFTLEHTKCEYQRLVQTWREEQQSFEVDEGEPVVPPMSFDEFCAFAKNYPLKTLDDHFISGIDDDSEEKVRGRFTDDTTARLPVSPYDLNLNSAYSERSYFGNLISFMHPYSVLRVLAECAENLDADVVWHYGPLVENGWATPQEFVACARRTETFLIATEGSTDVHILKHALAVLRPEIVDFFRFIDVSERHPFSGTGSLVKLAEGLAKIDVHNQVIFLFDNDAEGLDAHRRLSSLSLPLNMRGMLLPNLVQFLDFPTRGPEGDSRGDINGRAAAIECYLDLEYDGGPPAKVIWTNYKKEDDIYQGSLELKDFYTKKFLHLTPDRFVTTSYDTSKLLLLLDALVAECNSMAAAASSAFVL